MPTTAPQRANSQPIHEARRAFANGDIATTERICSEDACGAIFGLLGLHQRAKEFFLRAVAARPGVPQYLFNLAATERVTGALEQAEAHCDAAIALDRTYGLAHYLRSDLRIQTTVRNHIAEMEALIDGGRLAPPNEVMLRFAAGKEYEDLDLHARAFDHVKAGCDLQHGLVTYDHAAEAAPSCEAALCEERKPNTP